MKQQDIRYTQTVSLTTDYLHIKKPLLKREIRYISICTTVAKDNPVRATRFTGALLLHKERPMTFTIHLSNTSLL